MFENRSEQERKKIFWLIIISITAVIFIGWLILLAKGYVLKSARITEINNLNTNQANLSEIKSELKGTIDEFKQLDLKQKFSDIKNEISGLTNSQNQNQNENHNVNELNENTNQPENSESAQVDENNEVNEQNTLENTNNSSIPRLPIEN